MNTGHGLPQGHRPSFDAQEVSRRVEDMVQFGTVEEADYAAGKVRIRIGDPEQEGKSLLTDWLPWATARAGNNRHWVAPEIGEQVLLLSQSGNMSQGLILATINKTDYKHAALSPEVERKVWRLNQDLYDCLFHDVNRATPHDYRYVPDGGSFRQEVGKNFDGGSSIIQTQDSIELRVKNTKVVITDTGITMHVLGGTTEIKLGPASIEAHAAHLGVLTILPAAIRATAAGTGQVLITPAMVESSVAGLGVIRVTPVEVSLELTAQQVRTVLAGGAFRALVQDALMELIPGAAFIHGGPSHLTLGTSAVLVSPFFQGIQGESAPTLYLTGGSSLILTPPPLPPPPSIPRPSLEEGNPPTYPG